jgi:uncharacterized protein (TIGR00106 family)
VKVIVEFCLIPIGIGVSLSPYVAACENVLAEAGLKTTLHANGTNIEGEWDAVMAAIKRCHEAVHSMGAPRVLTTLRLGTRTDRTQTMEDKMESVRRKLQGRPPQRPRPQR